MEELAASGVLNRQQRIGVKHYTDFQERMQREEVAEIEQRVRRRGLSPSNVIRLRVYIPSPPLIFLSSKILVALCSVGSDVCMFRKKD